MDAELGCKWNFAPQPGGRDNGPNEPMETNFRKSRYASLIREAIQNSLDAVLDNTKPVKMVFTVRVLRRNDYPNFYELRKHIKGCLIYYNKNEDAKERYQPMLDFLDSIDPIRGEMEYIQIADYNTQGMDYIKDDTSSPFYAFVKSEGVSSKEEKKSGGSYGFGKAAYFYISRLRTVLVSTITSQGKCFFEGVSSLCTHTSPDGQKLAAVGYYDNNNGNPIDNLDSIPIRFRRQEPGTSIFIIGSNEGTEREKVYSQMLDAVLRNFWMAILNRKLEVEIGDKKSRWDNITADSLKEYMEQTFPEPDDSAAFAKNYNPRPYYMAATADTNDKNFFHTVIETQHLGKISFYAMKKKGANDKVVYMRAPMMVVFAKKRQTAYGYYGVFLCTDPEGNEKLKKMENSRHDEWKSFNWRDAEGKIQPKAKEVEDEIRNAITEAIKTMFPTKNNSIEYIPGLENFLYIPLAIDDNDNQNQSLIGNIEKGIATDTTSPTTSVNNTETNNNEKKETLGKVLITSPQRERHTKDPQGTLLAGHGTGQRKKKGGGGTSTDLINGHFIEGNDIEGAVLTEIPIKYRTFAIKENTIMTHHIIIHSPIELTNGRIDLLVGGDQNDEAIPIKTCSQGIIKENTIRNLHLNKGKNTLKITFADNMRHAIKLDAYENR